MKHKRLITNLLNISLILVILLAISGCLVREEIITIDEKGNGTIKYEIDGEIDKAKPLFALPSDKSWEISENSIKPSKENKYKINLKAEKNIPAGTAWPATYAGDNSANIYLNFPTETKVYKKNGRTFYEFRRRYEGRMNYQADYIYNDNDAQKLEAKIYEQGLFNVTEQERQDYLTNLAYKLAYRNWRVFIDVIGQLVKEGDIKALDKKELQLAAQPVLEKIFDTKVLLDVFSDDTKIALGLGFLDDDSDKAFEKLMIDRFGLNQDLIGKFNRLLAEQRLAYDITNEMSGQQFSIRVDLPGEIIETNGAIDPDTPNAVYWMFKGEDLMDKEISLYALSVVEN